MSCAKLAWWHLHDKTVYKYINEQRYGSMDTIAIGQEVEDVVKRLWSSVTEIDIDAIQNHARHQSYHDLSMNVIDDSPAIIYQEGFLVDDCFIKTDFLRRNDDGKYDLIEVKSKNSIRKKTKAQPLENDLKADISFQHRVLQQVLGDRYSGHAFIAHLNEEYIKDGKITPEEIIVLEEVTDDLHDDELVRSNIEVMRKHLSLDEQDFNQEYTYNGENPLLYFGKSAQP